jgi:hypothetical protein
MSRSRCTHAYADYVGREHMASCVLAIRDLTMEARDEHGTVTFLLTTTDRRSIATLQQRAHGMMAAPGADVPATTAARH